jgi:hypothetical protein
MLGEFVVEFIGEVAFELIVEILFRKVISPFFRIIGALTIWFFIFGRLPLKTIYEKDNNTRVGVIVLLILMIIIIGMLQ